VTYLSEEEVVSKKPKLPKRFTRSKKRTFRTKQSMNVNANEFTPKFNTQVREFIPALNIQASEFTPKTI